MRTNFVLIDYESVQPASLAAVEGDPYRVIVFVGSSQSKLSFDAVSAIQRMGERARYVKLAGAGHNALDFHIAFYIGELAAQDPSAFFHIISKDTGFDPLIRHLKSRHIFAARSGSIEDMPHVSSSPKTAARERARTVLSSLIQPKSTKPRTERTLRRHIEAFFSKQQLTEPEVSAIITAMETAGQVAIADGKVVYSLSA